MDSEALNALDRSLHWVGHARVRLLHDFPSSTELSSRHIYRIRSIRSRSKYLSTLMFCRWVPSGSHTTIQEPWRWPWVKHHRWLRCAADTGTFCLLYIWETDSRIVKVV